MRVERRGMPGWASALWRVKAPVFAPTLRSRTVIEAAATPS